MTPAERIAYWDSKPEIALQNEFGVLDRRVLIKHVACLLDEDNGHKAHLLEIGINQGHVLAYCYDVLWGYTGVDPDLSNLEEVNVEPCQKRIGEMESFAFWEQLHKRLLYDLIFVDGHHGTFEAYVDTTQAMFRLAPGGYVLAHDVNPPEGAEDYDAGPTFAHNRIKNLPGWYARILEGHPEGLAIYFRTT